MHVVPILTSAVIECHRANLRAASFEYATTLMRPEYRQQLQEAYKRKIEAIVRKPGDRVDVLEEETPSPFDPSARLPETALECPSTKNSIPYCIATGRQAVPRPPTAPSHRLTPRLPTGLHIAVPPPPTAPSHLRPPRRPTATHLAVPPPPTAPSHRPTNPSPTHAGISCWATCASALRANSLRSTRRSQSLSRARARRGRALVVVVYTWHEARRERGPGANSCWQQSPDHHPTITWLSRGHHPTVSRPSADRAFRRAVPDVHPAGVHAERAAHERR